MRPGLPATTMRRAWSCSSMSSRRPSWGTARVSSSGCSTSIEHRNANPGRNHRCGVARFPDGDRGGHVRRALAVRRARPSQRGDCRRGDPGGCGAPSRHLGRRDDLRRHAARRRLSAQGAADRRCGVGGGTPTRGSTIAIGHAWLAEEDIEDRMTGLFRTRLARYSSGSAWLVEYALHI